MAERRPCANSHSGWSSTASRSSTALHRTALPRMYGNGPDSCDLANPLRPAAARALRKLCEVKDLHFHVCSLKHFIRPPVLWEEVCNDAIQRSPSFHTTSSFLRVRCKCKLFKRTTLLGLDLWPSLSPRMRFERVPVESHA